MKKRESDLKNTIDLLKQKKALLGELLDLSQYHENFCREERFDKLNRLLKSQCLRIDKLKKLDKQVEVISEQEDDDKQNLSQFRVLKKEIDSLLREFQIINQDNQDIIHFTYQELREKILNINRAKRVRNIYQPSGKTSGFFVDRREKLRFKKG